MPEWLRYVAEVAVTILIPMLLWNARLLLDLRQDVRDMKLTLFGVQGDNGMNSDVKGLRAARDEHNRRLENHEYRIGTLEEGRP